MFNKRKSHHIVVGYWNYSQRQIRIVDKITPYCESGEVPLQTLNLVKFSFDFFKTALNAAAEVEACLRMKLTLTFVRDHKEFGQFYILIELEDVGIPFNLSTNNSQ